MPQFLCETCGGRLYHLMKSGNITNCRFCGCYLRERAGYGTRDETHINRCQAAPKKEKCDCAFREAMKNFSINLAAVPKIHVPVRSYPECEESWD